MDWLTILMAQIRFFVIRLTLLTDLGIRLFILKCKGYAYVYKNSAEDRKIMQLMAMVLVLSILSLIMGIKDMLHSHQISLHPEIQMREVHQAVRDDYPDLALIFAPFELCMDGIINPTFEKCDAEILPLVIKLGQRARYTEYRLQRTERYEWIKIRRRGDLPPPKRTK